ncbi:MAG: diguanylate cyclase [Proteobacteria bacterium]|nr:diguanylate cyclase [Pseudomonadota bacterium]
MPPSIAPDDPMPAPCPFCRSSETQVAADASGQWSTHCTDCGASGPRAGDHDEALARWAHACEGEVLLRTVIDESPDIILLKDWNGRFLLGNAALATLYGTTPDQLVGKDDGHFNPNREQVDFYLQNVRSVMLGGETQLVQESSTNAETGEIRHFHSIKKPLRGPDGDRRILVIAHDVTDLQRAHQVIEERERSYAYAMAAAGEGIWDWNVERGIVTHNASWCALLGFPPEELQHPIEVFAAHLHEDDRGTVLASIETALRESGHYCHEHRMRRRDGSEIWVLDRGEVVERDAAGRPIRMAGCVTDISARKRDEQALCKATEALAEMNARLEQKVAERTAALARANEELRLLARHDALTGLPNRLAGNERLSDEFIRMKRSGVPYAVVMMDLDHFKSINDCHGHAVGDAVLRHTAEVLRRSIRESDFVARFGGEEFLAIIPASDLSGARVVGEKIRQSIEASTAPIVERLTVSLGLALATPDHDDIHVAMRQADRGLYRAKRSGRNQLVIMTPAP